MKYSLAILALAAAATAQKIDACDGKAQPCVEDAIAEYGQCEAGDEACACEHMDEIQPLAASCVIEACGADGIGEVLAEVKEYCANLPADGGEEPAPTEGGEEPAPTEGGEEPAPTEGGEEPAPSAPAPSGEDPAAPGATEAPGNGTSPSEPPTAGARALAPAGALLVGLVAFAL